MRRPATFMPGTSPVMSDPPAETTEKLKRAPGACYLFNNQNRRGRAVSLLLTSCRSCQYHAASLIRDIKARILLAPGRFHGTYSTSSESGSRVIRVKRKIAECVIRALQTFLPFHFFRLADGVMCRNQYMFLRK